MWWALARTLAVLTIILTFIFFIVLGTKIIQYSNLNSEQYNGQR